MKRSFEMKQQFREEIKRVKELSREIISKNAAEKEAKKERRRQNLKRAEENQRKAEVVQVVSIIFSSCDRRSYITLDAL